MIRKQMNTLFPSIPDKGAKSFREAIISENLTRIIIGSAAIFIVETGVYITMEKVRSDTTYFPLSAVLFSLLMIPLLSILRKRADLIRLKQVLIFLCITFYLVWSCFFTWSTRTNGPNLEAYAPFSVYMLMVYGIAIFVYLETVRSALFFITSVVLFIAVMPFAAMNQKEISMNIWNALALNIFAWLTSRLIFAFRLRTFLDHRLIQEKNAELETERNNLKDALASVRHLTGLLPICSNCKKVRNDRGYWQQVEQYIEERSEATFSHSLCPECIKQLYPDTEKSKKNIDF
jgi:hypothetical protein